MVLYVTGAFVLGLLVGGVGMVLITIIAGRSISPFR